MQFNIIILVIYLSSLIFAIISGRVSELSAAAIKGAETAITLCFSLCGMICLWSAVMETMRRSGLADKLSNLLRPLLSKLFPNASKDRDTMSALSSNISANLLGLGNAATPAGIKAAIGMQKLSGGSTASNELCLLVVMNTASIQLLPTTVGSLRASMGAAAPFDILPAVWLSSLFSVMAGILAAKLFERYGKNDPLR